MPKIMKNSKLVGNSPPSETQNSARKTPINSNIEIWAQNPQGKWQKCGNKDIVIEKRKGGLDRAKKKGLKEYMRAIYQNTFLGKRDFSAQNTNSSMSSEHDREVNSDRSSKRQVKLRQAHILAKITRPTPPPEPSPPKPKNSEIYI